MRMDCRRWLELCDAWRAGGLDAATARACRDHAAACPDCAEVLALLDGSLAPAADGAPDLVADVLDATSGGSCGRARDRLGAAFGGAPDAPLASHLEHCPDCAALAGVLAWLPETLAGMAEAEPDARLAYDVLRATARPRARRRAGAWPRLGQRLGAWWERQARRPQFVWEAAWVATVVIVLLFAAPFSPGREAPRRALSAVQAGPGLVLERAGAAAGAAGRWLEGLAAAADERHDRAAPYRNDLRRHAGDLGEALLDGDLAAARDRLPLLGRDAADIWTIWRFGGAPRDSMHETNRDGA